MSVYRTIGPTLVIISDLLRDRLVYYLLFYIFHSINELAPVYVQAGMLLTWSAREQGFCNAVHMVQEGI